MQDGRTNKKANPETLIKVSHVCVLNVSRLAF